MVSDVCQQLKEKESTQVVEKEKISIMVTKKR